MKKLRRIIACLALVVGVGGVAVGTGVAPASALLSGCSLDYNYPNGYPAVYSYCAWQSGSPNQKQRAWGQCNVTPWGGGFYYGGWQTIYNRSVAYCPLGYYLNNYGLQIVNS